MSRPRRRPTKDEGQFAALMDVLDLIPALAELLREAEHHLGISKVDYADWHRRRRKILKRVERLCP